MFHRQITQRYKVSSLELQRRKIMYVLPREVAFALDWNPPSGQKYDYNFPCESHPKFYEDDPSMSPMSLPKKLTDLYYEMKNSGTERPRIICQLHTALIQVDPGKDLPEGGYEETFLYYTPAV